MNKKRTVDLIHGPILPSLLSFAFPILLSNIFQQLYNTADVLIVGRFLGQDSLAAVGATTAIFDLIVGFTLGVGNGMGIVIARYCSDAAGLSWFVSSFTVLGYPC